MEPTEIFFSVFVGAGLPKECDPETFRILIVGLDWNRQMSGPWNMKSFDPVLQGECRQDSKSINS